MELIKFETELKRLSGREQEVLDLIVYGATSQDAADKLYIGKRTVDVYRERVMEKLNCDNFAELVRKYILYKACCAISEIGSSILDEQLVIDKILLLGD